MDDPLRGLTKRQRIEHERHCARYFAKYRPAEHTGWLAEGLRAGRVRLLTRYDLDHPARGNVKRIQCYDCNADLQVSVLVGTPATYPLCLACGYRRAYQDEPC